VPAWRRARPDAPLSGDHRADVLVVGGGLPAAAAALELTQRGRSVLVLGRPTPSAADPGHVPSGPALPYATVVARLGRDAARGLWEVYRESHERLRELLAQLGEDLGYEARGAFLVARDRPEAIALADSEDLLREDGFAGEFLDHYMLEARFDVRGFAAAYWSEEDAELDPARLVAAIAGDAVRLGAAWHDEAVVGLGPSPGGVEAVTARGRVRASWALVVEGAARLPSLEGRLLEAVVRSASVTLPAGASLPTLGRGSGGLAWRATGSTLRLIVVEAPGRTPLDLAALAREHIGTETAGPAVKTSPAPAHPGDRRTTTGLAADGLPLVGVLPGLPIFVAAGMGGHGCGFAAARWAAESLSTGRDPTPAPLRADRRIELGGPWVR
jgi:glycine/D-amino acid oxidase-like deaminating enzyme